MKINIETSDVCRIFPNYSLRRAQDLLTDIRKANNKPRGATVTIREFCRYNLIAEDELRAALNPVSKAS